MDSFEWNKIFGALLGCAFFGLGVSFLSEGLYHASPPDTFGYAIEGDAAVSDHGSTPKAEVEIESVSSLLASADISSGEKVSKKCLACHTFASGGENKVGPALYGVVNRTVASADFGYSGALKDFSATHPVWDYDTLNRFLYKPKSLVKGTSMGFPGIKKVGDRADLILYLRSLSDSPVPLP